MEKGHMAVLIQPAELLILGGAAIGTLLIANPIQIVGRPERLAFHQCALPGHAQDDVPVSEQGAERGATQR